MLAFRSHALLCLLLAAVPARAAAPPARCEPALVLRVRSADDLLAALRHLGPRLGLESLLASLDQSLGSAAGGKKLGTVLATDQPLLAYERLPAGKDPIERGDEVVVLPVVGRQPFLAALARAWGVPLPVGGGLYRAAPALAPTRAVFCRFAHGHAYLSSHAAALRGPLARPAALAAGLDRDDLLDLTFPIDRLPAAARAELLEGLVEDDEDRRPQPGESDAEFRLRRAWTERWLGLCRDVVTSARSLRLAVRLDAKRHRLAARVVLTPGASGPLAATLAGLRRPASRLHALVQGRAFGVGVQLPVSGELVKRFMGGVRELGEHTVGPRQRIFLRRALRALEPTAERGYLEAVLVADHKKTETMALLAALRVKDVRAVEDLLRDHAKDLSAVERKALGLRWNHTRVDGVAVHRIHPGEGLALIGQPFFLAFEQETALVATSLPLLRDSLARLKKAPAGRPALVRLSAAPVSVVNGTVIALSHLNPRFFAQVHGAETAKDLTGLVEQFKRLAGGKLFALIKGIENIYSGPGFELILQGGADLRLEVALDTRLLAVVPALGLGLDQAGSAPRP